MREYELVAVLNPTLSQEGAQASWERIKRQITDRGGSIVREDHWGTRRLAYSLTHASQRFGEGNYYFARFNLTPKGAAELETSLRLAEDVLRFLVVKAEGPLPPPKPVATPEADQVATPAATGATPATEPPTASVVAPAPAPEAAPPSPATSA